MSERVTISEHLCLTEDRSRVVPETDPAARWLHWIPGQQVPRAEALRLGAIQPDPDPDPEPDPEPDPGTDPHRARVTAPAPGLGPGAGAGAGAGPTLDPTAPERYRVTLYERSTADPVPYRTPARLQWEGNDVACLTVRLSLEKVACEYPSDHPARPHSGMPARITLRLGGALAPLTARVRWSRLSGDVVEVGLQLEQLRPEHRALLARTLQEHAAG